MIFTRSFLPAVGLAVSAVASDIEQLPQATPYGHKREAALPRAPAPTAAPDVSERWGRMQLFDRADGLGTDTCGFLSEGSDRPYPLTCGTGWTCTNSASFRGCCQGAGCTTSSDVFYSSCFDATSTQCRSSVDGNTLCCTQTASFPYCVTYLYSTEKSPGVFFTQYNCDQQRFAGTFYLAATSPSSSSTSTTSRSRSSSDEEPVAAPTNTASGSKASSEEPSSSTPVGPIVGGVIGGVALLALIGFAIFFIIRKNRKDKQGYASPPGQSGPDMGQQQHQSPPPHAGSAYAPSTYPPSTVPGGVAGAAGGFQDPRYSYAPTMAPSSPTAAGGSPGPYQNNNNNMYNEAAHDPYKSPGSGDQQYFTPPPPPQAGGSPEIGQTPPPPPQGYVPHGGAPVEAPATNARGWGNNRAELA